ncbi:MAG: efflux RND transporter permease subunit [Candidatus Brocadiia bacterium]
MNLSDFSVQRPVTVWVGVILVVLFGALALLTLPVQMRPTVDRPEITVTTPYPGAAPPEVEQQVTNKLEEQLASVEDLKRITSVSRENESEIRLEFDWGVDKNIAQLNTQKRLNLVEDLPDDAEESIIKAIASDEAHPVMWVFARRKSEAQQPLDPFRVYRYCDEYVKPRLERVSGVGGVFLFGGPEREIRVVVDHPRMSAFGLTVGQVAEVLRRENLNVRGGPLERGKRRETARTVGQFQSLDDIASVIVAYRNGRPIYVSDFASVEDSYKEQLAEVRHDGQQTVVFGILRKTGTNTLRVIDNVERQIERVNAELLANQDFELEVAHKESTYIRQAIRNVEQNLGIGAVLATAVLLLFLRSFRSTLIIALAIPISLIATFIFIGALGRTVNIVSLAGLGFAVGMVVDSAIVVLENTFRHMEEGEVGERAARNAAREVWGAVLASTLTTMAVFLPIVFLQVEAGQLFKDIAIALACAVGMSLLVSLSVIPMLSSRWLRVDPEKERSRRRRAWRRALYIVAFGWLGRAVYTAFERLTGWLLRGTVRKVAAIALIAGPCVLVFLRLTPDLNYLPQGSRNFVFGFVFLPPGTNLEKAKRVTADVEAKVRAMPEVESHFSVTLVGGVRDSSFLGCELKEGYVDELDAFVAKLRGIIATSVPGLRFPPGVVLFKMSVFREAMFGKGLEVNIRGPDLDRLAAYAARCEEQIGAIPGVVVPIQNTLDIGNPERRIVPDRERAADLGFNVRDVADVIQTLVGGKIADTYKEGGEEYDITLIGADRDIRTEEDLENVILEAPDGTRVTLRDLARVVFAVGPTKLEHIDEVRSVTLKVQVEPDSPLQRVVNAIEREVAGPLRQEMPSGYSVSLYGAADRLKEALDALRPSVVLAVLITYLLMASLFQSFVYPFVIILTVPLSWAGALVGLRLMEGLHYAGVVPGLPEFNVITLIGFVILTGVVVNNAILIVHQALNLRREGAPQAAAIHEAVRQRIRPIFMSTTTSVLGMMPLAVGGGSGTELYTGLGSVVVGGLFFSSLFTVLLVPSAFALFLDLRRGLRRLLRLSPAADDAIPIVEESPADESPRPSRDARA